MQSTHVLVQSLHAMHSQVHVIGAISSQGNVSPLNLETAQQQILQKPPTATTHHPALHHHHRRSHPEPVEVTHHLPWK